MFQLSKSSRINKEANEEVAYSPSENTNSVDKITSPRSLVPCTPVLETSDVIDDDNDEELPTFDLFSSLGIETV